MNGNAHEVHLALHLAGGTFEESAVPTEVRAELYRSNPIESLDVVSCRAETDTGATVTIALGHPCVRDVPRLVRVEGTTGSAFVLADRTVLMTRDETTVTPLLRDPRTAMLRQVVAAVNERSVPGLGRVPIAAARAQVHLLDAAMAATPIVDVPDDAVAWVTSPMGRVRAIIGLEEMLILAAARNATLSEISGAPWMQSPGRFDARAMRTFEGPA